MDAIDQQLVDLLQRDARTTQQELARAVGLSQPSVAERIRKLEEQQQTILQLMDACRKLDGRPAVIAQQSPLHHSPIP